MPLQPDHRKKKKKNYVGNFSRLNHVMILFPLEEHLINLLNIFWIT